MKSLTLPAIFRFLGWTILIAAGFYFIYKNVPKYFNFTEQSYSPYFWPRHTMLFLHICGGLTATIIGPFNFIQKIRRTNIKVHRFLGRTYLISILLGSIAGMYMAATSQVNLAYAFGLGGLAFVWFSTSLMAYICIKNRNIVMHREWMIRSYVVTFAFTTFRLMGDLLAYWNVSDETTRLTLLSWICWSIPLFITEIILQSSKIKRKNLQSL